MANYYQQMIEDWESLREAINSGDYKNIPPRQFDVPGYSMTTKEDFGFLQLNPANTVDSSDWKFHISVDERDVPRAWNIVVDELVKDGNGHLAKVVKPDTARSFSNPDSIQAGKMITIYENGDYSPQQYADLMKRIEAKLDAVGIKPGPATNADRPIPGSKYGSYRRETGPDGQYMASADMKDVPKEQRFNPYNSPDPYKDIDLSGAYKGHVAEAQVKASTPLQIEEQRIANGVFSRTDERVQMVSINEKGFVDIEVDSTYSRGDLARELDIKGAPENLQRIASSDPNKAVIRVPAEQLPTDLQPRLQATSPSPVKDNVTTMVQPEPKGDFKISDLSVNGKEKALMHFDNVEDAQTALRSMDRPDGVEATFRQVGSSGRASITLTGDGALDTARNYDSNAPKAPSAPDADIDAGGKNFFSRAADGLSDLGKSSGLIGGAAIGVIAGGAALLGGASKAEAAQIAGESAVPYGETAMDLAEGDTEAAAKSGTVETVSNVASIGGAAVGAVVGQVLIPIPGVGAVIGGFVGGLVAGVGAGVATAKVIEHAEKPAGEKKGFFSKLFGRDKEEPKKPAETETKPSVKNTHEMEVAQKEPSSDAGTDIDLANIDFTNIKPVEMPSYSAEPVQIDLDGDGIPETEMKAVEMPSYSADPVTVDLDGDGIAETEITPAEMPRENASDMDWDEVVENCYNPASLSEQKGVAQNAFGQAHDADPATMKLVYQPEPNSSEYKEFMDKIDNSSQNSGFEQDARLNDVLKIG